MPSNQPRQTGRLLAWQGRGVAIIEWLVAIPIVLMIGLLSLQWAIIWQARHAAEYAAFLAARASATERGDAQSLERGMAEGLGPWWGISQTPQQVARLAEGLQAGWLAWERVWPPPTVFQDFAEQAIDAHGRPVSGARELPNDNLRFRSDAAGARSGVNVQEANRIAVQLTLGVPLQVPLVSALIVKVMQRLDDCSAAQPLQLVATRFGTPDASPDARQWACAVYRAPDKPGGPPGWRLPVRVVASARMHSPLRVSAKTRSDAVPAPPQRPGTGRLGDELLHAPNRDAAEPTRPDQGGSIVDDLQPDEGVSQNPNRPDRFEPPGQHEDECERA
ncbi:MAG: TadE/TadG family type IV pilus assembly protein [Burkholderiaceae bacterium]